ncbi:MAG TPA: TonB-dependent receptor [Chitinophagaceae bacterium]
MRMKLSYRIAFAVALLLFANNMLFAQTVTLAGIVRSGVETLPSATVSIANQTSATDKNGQFTFSLAPGEYTIIITHAGYKKIEASITIAAGKENKVAFDMIPNDMLEEITIMGSKTGTERNNLNTAVPIDVISSARLTQTGQPSVIQMLFYSLPSLNTDRLKVYEPITYRGMDPHHLLILLNNTRYHNSAWLNNGVPKSDLARGSTSNDLGSIPFAAIDKVEILRDGASAQYGSDAIAAVLNVRLKESIGKTMVYANTGQYHDGGGFKSWVGLHRGFLLKNIRLPASRQGFISFSGEVRTQAPTTRPEMYKGLVYEVYRPGMTAADSARTKAKDDSTLSANGIDRHIFSKNNGVAKVHSMGVLINGAYPINDRLKVFWTTTINYKKNSVWGNYRYPNDTTRVNKLIHPHGFKPIPISINWDATAIAGIKGALQNNWQWELSSSFGNNTNRCELENSNNASQLNTLGADAPASFYLSTLVYNLLTNNISFTKDFQEKNSNWRSHKLIIGAEWRFENYKTIAGDEAGYTDYDGPGGRLGGAIPSIGSVSNSDAVNKNRSASSMYINWEMEPTDRWLIDAASRYEYYNDFGSNLAGKLALRYKISPAFSIRSSVSNGYRAPSLQQRYWSGLQSFRGRTEINRVFNNESPITKAFHIPSLTAERAINLSAGITSGLSSSISFTLDGYLIQVKNRIVLSGIFRRTDPQVAAILVDHPGIDHVQFYANAINTRTYGIDAVVNANWTIRKTNIAVTLAGNINRQSIYGAVKTTDVVTNISNYSNTLFGIEERTTLKRDQPGEKVILSAFITKGKYSFTLRNTYFGTTAVATIVSNQVDTMFQTFSPRVLTDGNIKYNPKSWLTITLGANNIFNVFPDRIPNPSDGGSPYSNAATPYGINGRYYYLNMSFNW